MSHTVLRNKIFPYAFLFFIVICAYGTSLANDFVWDDYLNIVHNHFIKSLENFPSIFSRQYLTSPSDLAYLEQKNIGAGEMSYRPVVTVTYFIEYFFYGLNAFGYHLTNVLLHVVNTFLVYLLIRRLFGHYRIAFITALLFGVHPVQSEAVLTISFREDLLASCFMLIGFVLYWKIRQESHDLKPWGAYAMMILVYWLALFSKEMAITLPGLFLFAEYYLSQKNKWRAVYLALKKRFAGLLIATGGYLYVWGVLMKRASGGTIAYPGDSLYINGLTMIKVFGQYVWWFICPWQVHPTLIDQAFFADGFWRWDVWRALLSITALCVVLFLCARKNKWIGFGLGWFLLAMLPMSNIVPLQNIMASRYLYFPSIGVYFIMATVIEGFFQKDWPGFRWVSREALATGVIVLVLFYVILIWTQGLRWRNEISFRKFFLQNYPHIPSSYRVLAAAYKRAGRYEEAILMTQKAKAMVPLARDNYLDLVHLYLESGRDDLALNEIEALLSLYPDSAFLKNQRCLIFADQKKERAIDCFERLIRDEPEYLVAYYNLGVFYFHTRRFDQARGVWQKALLMDPDYKPAKEAMTFVRD